MLETPNRCHVRSEFQIVRLVLFTDPSYETVMDSATMAVVTRCHERCLIAVSNRVQELVINDHALAALQSSQLGHVLVPIARLGASFRFVFRRAHVRLANLRMVREHTNETVSVAILPIQADVMTESIRHPRKHRFISHDINLSREQITLASETITRAARLSTGHVKYLIHSAKKFQPEDLAEATQLTAKSADMPYINTHVPSVQNAIKWDDLRKRVGTAKRRSAWMLKEQLRIRLKPFTLEPNAVAARIVLGDATDEDRKLLANALAGVGNVSTLFAREDSADLSALTACAEPAVCAKDEAQDVAPPTDAT